MAGVQLVEPNGIYELPQGLGESSLILVAENEQTLVECHDTHFGDAIFKRRVNDSDNWLEFEVQDDGALGLVTLGDKADDDLIEETDWTVADLKLLGYLKNGAVVQKPDQTANRASSKNRKTTATTSRSIGQKWEYGFAEFVLTDKGYFLIAVNDTPHEPESLDEYSNWSGEQGWELVSAQMVKRSIRKNSMSISDFLKGTTNNIFDVLLLMFKRPKQ